MPGFFILFFKHVLRGKNHLFGAVVAEKTLQRNAKAFQHVLERGDGGRGKFPLYLGDKPFAQLAAVGEFLLGKAPLDAQFAQPFTDLHGADLLDGQGAIPDRT